MKKNTRKLTLHRESLRRLDEQELRRLDGGAAATNPCPYTLQVLACYSADVHTCYSCTV
ncbi:MAG: TIGR04149 family rSAM-modified RiPP [Thermoanaerobaculia bacterium]